MAAPGITITRAQDSDLEASASPSRPPPRRRMVDAFTETLPELSDNAAVSLVARFNAIYLDGLCVTVSVI